jgi:hypothetical protein
MSEGMNQAAWKLLWGMKKERKKRGEDEYTNR